MNTTLLDYIVILFRVQNVDNMMNRIVIQQFTVTIVYTIYIMHSWFIIRVANLVRLVWLVGFLLKEIRSKSDNNP